MTGGRGAPGYGPRVADVGDHDGTDAAAYVLKDFNASEHKELEFLLP